MIASVVSRAVSGAGAVTLAPFLLTEGSLEKKPPAFQFYARDWRSSPTVRQMNHKQRGIYIDLLAAAWDSEEPGTLPLPLTLTSKITGIDVRSLRDLLSKFPRTFIEVDSKLVNQKLRSQFDQMQRFTESKRVAGIKGNAVRWHSDSQKDPSASAFASASALASANSKETPDSSRTAFYFQNKKDEAAWKESHIGEGPSDQVQTGGFVMHTCELCGLRGTKGAVGQHKCGKLAVAK